MSTHVTTTLPVVLGTSSKYRIALFKENFSDIPFSTMSPSIDERAITAGYTDRATADPSTLTLAIAHAKADALLQEIETPSLLITSDQVVVCNNRIREKPSNETECREYLQSYVTHPLQTVSATVITNTATNTRHSGVDIAEQAFTSMPESIIDQLISKGDVLYCAGGITVEDPILAPVLGERKGSLNSIMGLPVTLVKRLLNESC